jgi:asparagine synthase (glutamine-hydrolysing)
VDSHQSGTSDYSAPLWTLVMFEAFLRNVVDGVPAVPARSHPELADAA